VIIKLLFFFGLSISVSAHDDMIRMLEDETKVDKPDFTMGRLHLGLAEFGQSKF